MSRDYSKINPPLEIPRWVVGFLVEKVRPHWTRLPPQLAQKIYDASTKGEPLVITQGDLDSLSDETWAELEKNL